MNTELLIELMLTYLWVIPVIICSIAISMLCRSLVHNLWHRYPETKLKLEKLFRKKIDDQWWDPAISHTNKNSIKWTIDIFGLRWITKVMVQFSDAFHTFNTIELGGYTTSISVFASVILSILGYGFWICLLGFFVSFIIVGIILFVIFFNIGYDDLWRLKK